MLFLDRMGINAEIQIPLKELGLPEKDFLYTEHLPDENERLRAFGCTSEVWYPPYWECVKEGNSNAMVTNKLVALDSQSDTYKEIEKLVLGTWESSTVGHDTDVAGLHHGSVAVRKIWRVESPVLYRQYEEKRKLMCMTKTVNSYPVFCGLGGEREVVTRTLGTFLLRNFLGSGKGK